MNRIVTTACAVFLAGLAASAQADTRILPMRERAAVIDQWLAERGRRACTQS